VLTLSPAVRIYVATGATDLRRSIDGLAALARQRLDLDPLAGHLFLFRGRDPRESGFGPPQSRAIAVSAAPHHVGRPHRATAIARA